jgi:hypothetical protein
MWQAHEAKVIILTRGDLTSGGNANPCGDVWLNREKSAEVIVPMKIGKGRTVVVFETEKGGQRDKCRKLIKQAGIAKIGWNPKITMECGVPDRRTQR